MNFSCTFDLCRGPRQRPATPLGATYRRYVVDERCDGPVTTIYRPRSGSTGQNRTAATFSECADAASGRLHLPGLPLALVRIEEPLADAHDLRRHLDQLVLLDVGDRLLQ